MSEQTRPGETRFQAGIVVDTHIHTVDYLPAFALSTFRWFIRRTRRIQMAESWLRG